MGIQAALTLHLPAAPTASLETRTFFGVTPPWHTEAFRNTVKTGSCSQKNVHTSTLALRGLVGTFTFGLQGALGPQCETPVLEPRPSRGGDPSVISGVSGPQNRDPALSLLGDGLLLKGEQGERQVPVVGCSGAPTRLPGRTEKAGWSVVSEEAPPTPHTLNVCLGIRKT